MATTTESTGAAPGSVIAAGKNGIDVACASGALRMYELQRPGRRRVSAGELSDQLDLCGLRLL
jgi:methionyl-tRNA formyltransferase